MPLGVDGDDDGDGKGGPCEVRSTVNILELLDDIRKIVN